MLLVPGLLPDVGRVAVEEAAVQLRLSLDLHEAQREDVKES